MNEKLLLTAEEAAKILKISKYTLYELVKQGKIPAQKVGRQIRINKEELYNYFKDNSEQAALNKEQSDKEYSEAYPKANSLRFSGSHDPILELLIDLLKHSTEKIEIEATFVGSMEGLIALYKRQADIVGAHLWDEDTQDYNTPFIRYVLPEEEVVAVNLVQRQQGLLLQPGNPLNIKGIEDLNKEEVRFINRQKGSGTRLRLDSFLKKYDISSSAIEGYDEEENTHMGVACRISNGDANVGIAVQSVAQRLGLDFIPLFKERYDLICLKKTSQTKAWKNIIKLITTDHFQHAVQNHAGYDTSLTGTYIIGGD
jgi:putative molybdopterin biosynthesis protein